MKFKIGKEKYNVEKLPQKYQNELKKLMNEVKNDQKVQPEKNGVMEWFNWLWR
jgi:hypothetical protein